jgi:hypothetical protein
MKPDKFIFLVVLCSFYLSVSGQNSKLIENRNSPNEEAKALRILQKSTAYVSIDFVSINIEKLLIMKNSFLNLEKIAYPFIKKEWMYEVLRISVLLAGMKKETVL